MKRPSPDAGPGSAAPPPVADAGQQAGWDDDDQPWGYHIGGCGHRRPLSVTGRLGDCECDLGASRPAVPDFRLPAAELYSIDVMASAGTVSWWCRLCDRDATAASFPAADAAAVEHLAAQHGATAVATT